MKGKLHTDPPPGYITAADAAQALGMSKANFHKKNGYAQALDRWQLGSGKGGTLIFLKEDVAGMARWREVRKGMIALGHWHPSTPGVPTDSDYHTAIDIGYWDVDCPRCGGREAVGVPDDDRVWCPDCNK